MLKKSLIASLIFCLITFMSSFIFATNIVNGAGNMLRDAGNGIEGAIDKTEDSARNAKNGMSNMMDNMRDNDRKNETDDMGIGGFRDNGDTGDYTATRTNAYSNGVTRNNSSLVWMILAIVAIIIVALVWYYGTQSNTNRNH